MERDADRYRVMKRAVGTGERRETERECRERAGDKIGCQSFERDKKAGGRQERVSKSTETNTSTVFALPNCAY
jgi:hypothetical protein